MQKVKRRTSKEMKTISEGKGLIKDIIYDILGAILQAVGVWCFIEPCMIAPGGASGLALLFGFVTGLPIGILTLIINIPILISSYILLDRKMTFRTIRTVVIMSVVLDYGVAGILPQYQGERLITAALGGILVGVGMAVIFMRNSTTGGGDILAKLLQKKFPYLHTGYAIMLIDFAIIGISVLIFRDLDSAIYGIISMVCTTQTIDAILYGMNKGTMITVLSPKNREISQEIMERLDRGTTLLKSVGGYSQKERETLMCVVDRKQFYIVKEIIDHHDSQAFVIVSETKEVYGEGFLNDPRLSEGK